MTRRVHVEDGFDNDPAGELIITGPVGKRRVYLQSAITRIKPLLNLSPEQIAKLEEWVPSAENPVAVGFEKVLGGGSVNGRLFNFFIKLVPLVGNQIEDDIFERDVDAFSAQVQSNYRPLSGWAEKTKKEWVFAHKVGPVFSNEPDRVRAIAFTNTVIPVEVVQIRERHFVAEGERWQEPWAIVVLRDEKENVLRGATDRLLVLDIPYRSLLHLSPADLTSAEKRLAKDGLAGADEMGIQAYTLDIVKYAFPPRNFEVLKDAVKARVKDKQLDTAELYSRFKALSALGAIDPDETEADKAKWQIERIVPVTPARPTGVRDADLPGNHPWAADLKYFKGRSVDRQKQAYINLLGGKLSEDVQQALAHYLLSTGKSAPKLRDEIISILARTDLTVAESVERELLYYVNAKNTDVAKAAMTILTRRGVTTLAGRLDLVDILSSQPGESAAFAARQLGHSGIAHPLVVSRLLRSLRSSNRTFFAREKISQLFESIGSTEFDSTLDWSAVRLMIADILSSENHHLAVRSAIWLSTKILVSGRTQRHLVQFLGDRTKKTRAVAMWALNAQRNLKLDHHVMTLLVGQLLNQRARDISFELLKEWFDPEADEEAAHRLIGFAEGADLPLKARADLLLRRRTISPPADVDPDVEAVRKACNKDDAP